jgi:hypothetical protein
MPGKSPPPDLLGEEFVDRFVRAILGFLGRIPRTSEQQSPTPAERARTIAKVAALKAAATSGTLSLPPGPLGLVTVLPDLVEVWRIQAKMVADIAGAFGKEAYLSREQMLYCLFRQAAAQAVRDLVVRVGERVLIRKTSFRALEELAAKIGVRVTERVIGRGVSRLLPVAGALGMAGYSYYDTAKVAETAVDLFSREIVTALPPEEVAAGSIESGNSSEVGLAHQQDDAKRAPAERLALTGRRKAATAKATVSRRRRVPAGDAVAREQAKGRTRGKQAPDVAGQPPLRPKAR